MPPVPAADPGDAGFAAHRTHLTGVAYRLTGSVADAEDAVQDAWLRLAALDPAARAGVRDLRAWLTTVVAHLCLDRLRSATARRERYVGPWLPEPLVTAPEADGPLAAVVRDEGVRMAAMVVLDRLSPPQRVALVLHEALDVPFADIADVLGCSVAAARQHASRARRIVAEADPPARATVAEQQDLLAAFAAAVQAGDPATLVRLLHPDAVWVSDGGGRVQAARRTIAGADKVARALVAFAAKYPAGSLAAVTPVLVNGELGMWVPATAGNPASVTVLSLRAGRVVAGYQVLNPEKLPTR